MPRKQTLKVFRTPIGFHDAYVAAPSRRAALQAWGSDADPFARGIAEVVTDADLTREPLKRPGTVIRRLRGTAEEQLAALPTDKPLRQPKAIIDKAKPAGRSKAAVKPVRTPPAPPRPSRAALEEGEGQLEALRERQRAEQQALRDKEEALARERRTMERAQARDSPPPSV